MSAKDIFQNHTLHIYILSGVLTLLTVIHIASPIMIGLDPAYKFAYNYFFVHNIQMGTDILFTMGPLGFLYSPSPMGNNILIATILVLILKFIFIFTVIKLYEDIRDNMSIVRWITITIVTYIFTSKIGLHHLLMFTPLLLVLRYSIKENIKFIVLAAVITAIALLTKSSTGILSLLILLSYVVYMFYHKEYKVFFVFAIVTSLAFLTIWFSLYQNLAGIYDYFYATLEFSRGNSSAMTINPDNNWWIFTLFVILYITYPLFQREKTIVLLYGITLLSIAAMFKFAMSREDHIAAFESYLYDLLFVSFLVSKNFNYKAFIHLLVAYVTFIFFMLQTPWEDRIKDRLRRTHIPNIPLKYISALDVKNEFHVLKKVSTQNLKRRKLNEELKKMIGSSTIDVYPSYSTYFATNKMNWNPRPVIQAYVAYTPYLDNKNATFFDSDHAPEFLIWHWDGTMDGISKRYLLNENPAGLYQIFNHYSLDYETQGLRLLKHTNDNLLSKNLLEKKTYTWNEWFDVPQIVDKYESTFILAKMDIKRSMLQKLKKLIYKEFDVFIEYKLLDQRIIRHRLVVDLVNNGVWANPLLDGLFTYPITSQVVSMRLIHDKNDYFEEEFMIQWEKVEGSKRLFEVRESKVVSIPKRHFTTNVKYTLEEYVETDNYLKLRGWAFIDKKIIDTTLKYVVYKGENHTFIFTTYKEHRRDVTRYFKAKDLSSSGYVAYIPKEDLLIPDTYVLSLLLVDVNGTQHMVSLNKKVQIK